MPTMESSPQNIDHSASYIDKMEDDKTWPLLEVKMVTRSMIITQ